MEFLQQLNWLAVGQIIIIDILLGGDNAIVIALACRNLSPNLRTKGILWGTVGAIVLRILLISFAVALLKIPYLKLVGGVVLLWIGIKLLADDDNSHTDVHASERLLAAVKTIMVADFIMSTDNVIAVASAAERAEGQNQLTLVILGILISIPIIVWGSTVVLRLMERFPIIITVGAGLLGYLGGGMIVSDAGLTRWTGNLLSSLELVLPGNLMRLSLPGLAGAALVVWLGHRMERNRNGHSE